MGETERTPSASETVQEMWKSAPVATSLLESDTEDTVGGFWSSGPSVTSYSRGSVVKVGQSSPFSSACVVS